MMADACAIVNSRLLVPVYDDPEVSETMDRSATVNHDHL